MKNVTSVKTRLRWLVGIEEGQDRLSALVRTPTGFRASSTRLLGMVRELTVPPGPRRIGYRLIQRYRFLACCQLKILTSLLHNVRRGLNAADNCIACRA